MLDNPQVLALCASFLLGIALVLTQFGLRHMPPNRGASVSIPTSALLFSALAPFMLDWEGWDPRGALIFVLVGLLFPATVTLLTFQANRRMTQNNLGDASTKLGERESGTVRLKEAVAAYREALKELTRENAPYYQNITQESLDRTLKLLEERMAKMQSEPRDES